MICSGCGKIIKLEEKFCSECGRQTHVNDEKLSDETKKIILDIMKNHK